MAGLGPSLRAFHCDHFNALWLISQALFPLYYFQSIFPTTAQAQLETESLPPHQARKSCDSAVQVLVNQAPIFVGDLISKHMLLCSCWCLCVSVHIYIYIYLLKYSSYIVKINAFEVSFSKYMLHPSMQSALPRAYYGWVSDYVETFHVSMSWECPEISAQAISSAGNAAFTVIPHPHNCMSKYHPDFKANFNAISLVNFSRICPLQLSQKEPLDPLNSHHTSS